MNIPENTPILVGAGQFAERIDDAAYVGYSPVEIAAQAAQAAIEDAGAASALLEHVDYVACTRTFEDSSPMPAAFGKAKNFPWALSKRLGISPQAAYWAKAGGDSPQFLVGKTAELLAEGKVKVALLAGGEAISTVRHLNKQGVQKNWNDDADGPVEDGGWGLKGIMTHYASTHGLVSAPVGYALFENARAGRLGLGAGDYAGEMGKLFAPFTQVAADNPFSSSTQEAKGVSDLIALGASNRMIAFPYMQRVVAKDQVNQGAALVMTTVGQALALGIPQERWVFLHGYSHLVEKDILHREDLSQSPAARKAADVALAAAAVTVDDIAYFDFYSCFPIAVFNVATDHLGLAHDDPRGLTVTGGLPYFGGPGNNYSMHAIATMLERLRKKPGTLGFVGANGGFLSKYAVGIYSTEPAPWKKCDMAPVQSELDAQHAPKVIEQANGAAVVETFTVSYIKGMPAFGIVVGRMEGTGERFIANTVEGDGNTLEALVYASPIGRRIFVRHTAKGNRCSFDAELLRQRFQYVPSGLRESYEFCKVQRSGRVLEVTINRPEARNSLHPMANEELDSIFSEFEADPDLWVAILTGEGEAAFCTGNDLKYSASGKPMWVPLNGFAGLTSRRNRTKPVIAAVNGFAMGGGLEICLACDIVVADEAAQFALSEVRVGLIAGAGGLVRLPRQIPKKIATELILTGRKFSAQQAQAFGLVGSIAPQGAALSAARALAAEILGASPTAVRISLQMMERAEAHSAIVDAIEDRGSAIDELLTSEDMLEGMMAFAQKRPPMWKNR